MISHDAPLGLALRGASWVPERLQIASQQNQFGLSSVIEATRPKLVVHGHWHYRLTTLLEDVLIVSLGWDGDRLRDRGLILDVGSLTTAEDGHPKMAGAIYFE